MKERSKQGMVGFIVIALIAVAIFFLVKPNNNQVEPEAPVIEQQETQKEVVEKPKEDNGPIEATDFPGEYEIKYDFSMDYAYIEDDIKISGQHQSYDILVLNDFDKKKCLQLARYLESQVDCIEITVRFHTRYDEDKGIQHADDTLCEIIMRDSRIIDLENIGLVDPNYLTDIEFLNQ